MTVEHGEGVRVVLPNADNRQNSGKRNRCAATESAPCVAPAGLLIVARVPGFREVATWWCGEHFDALDLDAMQAALPDGSRVASFVFGRHLRAVV